MVPSIYTGTGGWFFEYIREPKVGSFNIYGRRRLFLSLFTAAGDLSFQHIR